MQVGSQLTLSIFENKERYDEYISVLVGELEYGMSGGLAIGPTCVRAPTQSIGSCLAVNFTKEVSTAGWTGASGMFKVHFITTSICS